MPTVPTPFIGGSGGPPANRPGGEGLEPPFVVDRDDTREEIEEARSASAAPAFDEGPVAEPEPPTSATDEAPGVPAAPADELVLDELVEESAPASEGEALIDEVFREFPLDEPEPAQGPVEPSTASAATVDAVPPGPDVGAADIGEDELPDFLTGSDSVGPDLEEAAAPQDAGPAPWDEHIDEQEEDVTARARELLHGKFGDSIRKLAAELGTSDEETLSRAFAAGYLAAKRERQE